MAKKPARAEAGGEGRFGAAVPGVFDIPAAIRYALLTTQHQPVTNDARCRSREVIRVDFDSPVGEDEQEQVDRRGDFLAVIGVGFVEEAVGYEGIDP